jgi:hypothetical protein
MAFAHVAMGGDAAGCADFLSLGKRGADFAGSAGGFESAAERINAGGAEGFEFLPANGQQFIVGFFFHAIGGGVEFCASGDQSIGA